MRRGRKSISQTPAPPKERIKGSKVNPKGSAESKNSASSIKLSDSIISTLEKKAEEYNKKHPNKKVRVSTLKAVFRRGAGAYSTSHRPTITGGAPNSRSAWAFARVNKFLLKKGGTKVKAAYVQDDDLMKDGGLLKSLSMGMDNLKKNGIVLKDESTIVIAYNTGNQKIEPSLYNKALIYKSIKPIKSASNIIEKLDLEQYERFDEDKINEYKKGHLIILNQNEVIYDSENEEITCHNCGWHWNTDDSKKFDKYVCHKCGFDNKIYYMHKRGGNLPVGKLARGMSVSEVAAVHGLQAKDIKKELILGIETEMEHTDKSEYARAIALDHLYEDPRYYTKLKKMEGLDKHYEDISKKYANGGTIQEVFHLTTPTGEKSSLSYLQQVLVRTKAFKNWFGDWEMAARLFLQDGKDNFEKHYKDVSKVLDYNTLEPRVVYHGTRVENEFFVFDATREAGQGRPYGYFAHNIEYSQNFTTSSQRGHSGAKPYLYQCFVNIRNPFMAIGQQYEGKSRSAEDWLYIITASIMWDKYGKIEKNSQTEGLALAVISQISKYLENTWRGSKEPFWVAMARI